MYKAYGFEHRNFGKMEVIIGEGRILFSDNFLKEKLKVLNKELPGASDIYDKNDCWVDFREVFEYIRYSKANEETRWEFEEWIEEVIRDCVKLA